MADSWTRTTHDWRSSVDRAHLRLIADSPEVFSPGGARHLLYEVLAYVADEARAMGSQPGRCHVVLRSDGSVGVRDFGRGTDTRRDDTGAVVRKPVMATKDLRFFDTVASYLPDGHPRRGMSVVCALSEWALHENRRLDGAWVQRYEGGSPVDELLELEPNGSTGTLIEFKPIADLDPVRDLDGDTLMADWPSLDIQVEGLV